MADLKQALELILEGQRLFDEGRLGDALAVLQAAVEADPTLPDPWIDIAAVLRRIGSREGEALTADRSLVKLGASVPELAAEVAQAKARISQSDDAAAQSRRAASWNDHYATHAAWFSYFQQLTIHQRREATRRNEPEIRRLNEKIAKLVEESSANHGGPIRFGANRGGYRMSARHHRKEERLSKKRSAYQARIRELEEFAGFDPSRLSATERAQQVEIHPEWIALGRCQWCGVSLDEQPPALPTPPPLPSA